MEPGLRKHSVKTHFPKDPNCDISASVVPRAEHFGDLISADHKVSSEESESRNNMPWWYKIWQRSAYNHTREKQNFTGHPEEPNEVPGADEETKSHLHGQFLEIWQVLRGIILESLRVNTTRNRNKWDCRKSSAQSERRDICGAIAVRSGKRMVGGLMECDCYLRNIQDLLSDGKTQHERRFGMPFGGPVIPFGAMVPVSAKDQSRVHQFGAKVLPGLFLGCALYAGRIWRGDVVVADIEDLEEMDASELHTPRLNAKEVLTPQRSGNFIFPVADGTVKICGGEQHLSTSTSTRDRPERGENKKFFK